MEREAALEGEILIEGAHLLAPPGQARAGSCDGFGAAMKRDLSLAVAADEAGCLSYLALKAEGKNVLLLSPEEISAWHERGEAPAICRHFLGLMHWYGEQVDARVRSKMASRDKSEIYTCTVFLSKALRAKREASGIPAGREDLLRDFKGFTPKSCPVMNVAALLSMGLAPVAVAAKAVLAGGRPFGGGVAG